MDQRLCSLCEAEAVSEARTASSNQFIMRNPRHMFDIVDGSVYMLLRQA
jgi:hypothetical protein